MTPIPTTTTTATQTRMAAMPTRLRLQCQHDDDNGNLAFRLGISSWCRIQTDTLAHTHTQSQINQAIRAATTTPTSTPTNTHTVAPTPPTHSIRIAFPCMVTIKGNATNSEFVAISAKCTNAWQHMMSNTHTLTQTQRRLHPHTHALTQHSFMRNEVKWRPETAAFFRISIQSGLDIPNICFLLHYANDRERERVRGGREILRPVVANLFEPN